jgi:hypothetical protein
MVLGAIHPRKTEVRFAISRPFHDTEHVRFPPEVVWSAVIECKFLIIRDPAS